MHKATTVTALSAAIMISGCAMSPKWSNPHLDGRADVLQRQLVIDDGYCTRVAAGSVPMPVVRTYEPAPRVYNIDAQVSGYNYGTGTYSSHQITGTATAAPGGFAGGFSSGLANGAALGQAIRAKKEHERVHRGCMYALGWTEE